MSSKNLNQTQRLFGDLSLKNKSTVSVNCAAVNNSASTAPPTNSCGSNNEHTAGTGTADSDFHYRCASAYKHSSPELHDLIRFQNAIMMKYQHTHDQHFKNIALALQPQIEDKIRDFHRTN